MGQYTDWERSGERPHRANGHPQRESGGGEWQDEQRQFEGGESGRWSGEERGRGGWQQDRARSENPRRRPDDYEQGVRGQRFAPERGRGEQFGQGSGYQQSRYGEDEEQYIGQPHRQPGTRPQDYGQHGFGPQQGYGYGQEGLREQGGRQGGQEGYGQQGYGRQGYGQQGYGRFEQESYSRAGRFGEQRGWGAQGGGYRGQGYEQTSYGREGFGHGNYGYAGERSQGYGRLGEGGRGQETFRGRGPRSYQRSDERIREEICDRLTDDDAIDATEIEVRVKDCEVVLAGFVPDRETKRMAEDLAESVSGVKDVRNELKLQREDRGQQSASASRSGSTGEHAGASTSGEAGKSATQRKS